ncbi:MAG: hypothetical protein ACR2RE_13915, partial [Geminicoccaceae bacterium]
MNIDQHPLKRSGHILKLLALAVPLAGCATAALQSSHLGPPERIEHAIKQHYADHAFEQRGRCTRPFIDAITKVDVIEDGGDKWVAEIRYRYRDRLRDEDTGSSRRICQGFASRTFTLVSGQSDRAVAEMS